MAESEKSEAQVFGSASALALGEPVSSPLGPLEAGRWMNGLQFCGPTVPVGLLRPLHAE